VGISSQTKLGILSILCASLLLGCMAKGKVVRDSEGRILEWYCTRGASCSEEGENEKVSIDSQLKSPFAGMFSLGTSLK